ncbi:MAG: carboxypeptidase M32 [Chloroflexota bacterium]
MEKKLAELKQYLSEVHDLNMANAVLSWDQATYMPPGGAAARGRQMATIGRLSHEKFTSARVGQLLDDLQAYGESLPYDSDDASLIRVTRKQYERATQIPGDLLAKFMAHSAASYQAWATARPANDFASVQEGLEKTLDFSRQIADCFPGYDHIADPLIDNSDSGMKAQDIQRIFAELRGALVPLVQAIADKELIDNSCLHQHFDEAKQLAFGTAVATDFGYDFQRGRQDKTHHPFATKFSIGDVRITTRVDENNLGDGLFSTLHEAGHGMYEQGVSWSLDATPLDTGTSAGVHESQSRLWENVVGRSRGMWQHYYPQLQKVFPSQLGNVSLDTFYAAINKVEPSLIRTEADEVTYNLHVMIRFDLELALLEGKLAVKDLPEAWHACYESDLGVRAPSDVNGVLQDVHWFAGLIGGSFQGYTLGNIMSALFYDQAVRAHPSMPNELAQGEFKTLFGWMNDNIYQHGSKFTANEVIEKATGQPLTIEPYMAYLRGKFGDLYGLA